jgi:hypothetical protein
MNKKGVTFFIEKNEYQKFKLNSVKNETTISELLREFIKKYNKDNEEK